jgi:LPXTG-motif cell wall-anchored protein
MAESRRIMKPLTSLIPMTVLATAAVLVLGSPALADPTSSPSPAVSTSTSARTSVSPSPTTASTGVLTGVVVDQETGAGVLWAAVSLTRNGRNTEGWVATTDETGHYTLAAPAGPWSLVVTMDARAEFWPYVDRWVGRAAPWANALPVDVVAGATTRFDVPLYRGGRIEGRVVDAHGAPIQGSRLTAWVEDEASHVTLGSGRTEVDGSFVLYAAAAPPTTARVYVLADGSGVPLQSPVHTVGVGFVLTGVLVSPAGTPEPSSGDGGDCGAAECGGGLPQTGAGTVLALTVLGLALVAGGTALAVMERRRRVRA